MSSNSNSNSKDFVKHSEPILINTSARRARSVSVSSSSMSSLGSSPEIQTPASPANSPRINMSPTSSSPILYYLAQSPTKSPATGTFPFNRKFRPPPVEEEPEVPVALHARRTSATVAGKFLQSQSTVPDPQLERGTGLLRRLSLSTGAFAKPPDAQPYPPTPPPNTAVSPTVKAPFPRETKPRRSATINEGTRSRRVPSPMGERILKGHFDGFN